MAAESFDGYQIYSPNVVKGETEIEARGYYFADDHRGVDQTNSGRLAIGHAFTRYWASELYGTYASVPGNSPEYEVEWENRFQLTPQGKYWADVGALVELERASPTEGNEPFAVRYGVLLEKQLSHWVATLDLFLENQFGPNADNQTEFQYVGRLKYRLDRRFEPDVEFYGAPGAIGGEGFADLPAEQHQIGPGFSGALPLAGAKTFKYSTALLFGATRTSPDVTPVVRVEYEFY
ncbi:MAG: hypothetical protein PF501_19940 [Salinisphaera sp.]|nr:hypothetical protein [Salinisphaera sp.]